MHSHLSRIGIDGLHNSILSDLVLRYSPEYYTFLANSTNVVFNNFDISGYSSSSNLAKNTDGWDTYRSTDITIMNSVINNGDGELHSPPLPIEPDRKSSPGLRLTHHHRRLRLLQTQLHLHSCRVPLVQRLARHLSRLTRPVRGRI